jgi:hypothetical protein
MAENSSHELSGVARKKFQLGRIFNDKLNWNQQHSNPDCINVFIYCNHTILMGNCDITWNLKDKLIVFALMHHIW